MYCKLLLTFYRACKITCSYDDLLFQSSVSYSIHGKNNVHNSKHTIGTVLLNNVFVNNTKQSLFHQCKTKGYFRSHHLYKRLCCFYVDMVYLNVLFTVFSCTVLLFNCVMCCKSVTRVVHSFRKSTAKFAIVIKSFNVCY